jgi:hypothetical protein
MCMGIGCSSAGNSPKLLQVFSSASCMSFITRITDLQRFTVFIEANKPPKAMIAYEKALDWQGLFDLAIRSDIEEEDLISMGTRVAGTCGSITLKQKR